MTAKSQHSLAEPLLARLPSTFSPEERERVRNAYEFAARWHRGQWRKSGDVFITHPIAVAEAAAAAGLDCAMVCAALLHDLPDDTDCDPELLRAEFGEEVADLVGRLSALRNHAADSDDDRAITLKLLDRLHNMRTIEYVDAAKQLTSSQETLEVLVPHARCSAARSARAACGPRPSGGIVEPGNLRRPVTGSQQCGQDAHRGRLAGGVGIPVGQRTAGWPIAVTACPAHWFQQLAGLARVPWW
jgi:hypothetical protein